MDRCNRTAQYINGKDQIEKLNEYLSISTKIKDRNENHAKIFHDNMWLMVKMM